MRLVKPKPIIPSAPPGSGSAGNYRQLPPAMPGWLREYIANQGVYVLLSCGHKENLNGPAVLIIAREFGKVDVICERCNTPSRVTRHMKFLEYVGITARPDTQDPLF